MDTLAPLLFSLFLAAAAVTIANGRALMGPELAAERFGRVGIVRPADAPDAAAPPAFVARLQHRERAALVGSGAAALLATVLAWVLGFTPASPIIVMVGAQLGRVAVLAVLGAREASALSDGPRLSTGQRLTLRDYLPGWVLPALRVIQVVVGVLAVVLAPSQHRVWVALAALVSLVVAVGADVLAVWLAGSPLRASSVDERGWAEALRREDVVTLVMSGPMVTVVACARPEPPGGWWGVVWLV